MFKNYRYIYWITDFEIERARLDGSDRVHLVNTIVDFRRGLAIEQKTQKLYWTETYSRDGEVQVTVANLDGRSRKRLHMMKNAVFATSLVVAKDFVYWQQYRREGSDQYKPEGVWGLPRNGSQLAALYATSEPGCRGCHRVAAHYSIREQILGVARCASLRRLLSNMQPEPADALCRNYCLRGYCFDSAEGRPACSCDAGYSGERCEVYACHQYCSNGGVCSLNEDGEPVCQCTAGYVGERCDVSICKDYCLHQGNCSVGAESQPNCSCAAGYSGERCEVELCREHCLHGGACSVRESTRGCECAAGYSGERCEVAACQDYCLHGNCSVGAEGELTCR
ncbi:hypothetical protein PYW07_007567 [Mythimna separata]|uniref:EGF-like domain-containing protein n=1 Tax=Mythimna separata TaxID=271217 RepID=A0AAD7Z259_MYTSE|nr:hypothetical protein PYW07_007567 [Mythimna separata]